MKELRLKSFDDLHKLWYVLYKEKNLLNTEKNFARRKSLVFPDYTRWKKVKKGMAAIRTVLGERQRGVYITTMDTPDELREKVARAVEMKEDAKKS